MKTARAFIHWVPEDQGGRRLPPSGPDYSTLVRFVPDAWPPAEAWSLVVHKIRCIDSPDCWLVDVRFLVPEAPQDKLVSGRDFELYEGWKRVARGRIE